MKAFYTLFLILVVGTTYGQSNLPACKGGDTSKWTNCFGIENYTKDEKYIGEWSKGNANGKGTHYLGGEFKGNKYVGEFKDNTYHGQGTYFHADGRIGLGEWINSKPNGRFIEYDSDKNIVSSGLFKDGKVASSQYIDPNSFTRLGSIDPEPSVPVTTKNNTQFDLQSLSGAKDKCEELGFKPATEGFGKCVLQLTK